MAHGAGQSNEYGKQSRSGHGGFPDMIVIDYMPAN
jgi:hypothetical protein